MAATTDSRFAAVAQILDTLEGDWRAHLLASGIDFEGMLEELGHTGSERLRIRSAWSLWNGGVEVGLDDLAFGLDSRNHATVLAAIAMCRLSVEESVRASPQQALVAVSGRLAT